MNIQAKVKCQIRLPWGVDVVSPGQIIRDLPDKFEFEEGHFSIIGESEKPAGAYPKIGTYDYFKIVTKDEMVEDDGWNVAKAKKFVNTLGIAIWKDIESTAEDKGKSGFVDDFIKNRDLGLSGDLPKAPEPD